MVRKAWSQDVVGSAMYQCWQKLKLVKIELKKLHREEFAGIERRLTQRQAELQEVQHQLIQDPDDISLTGAGTM